MSFTLENEEKPLTTVLFNNNNFTRLHTSAINKFKFMILKLESTREKIW